MAAGKERNQVAPSRERRRQGPIEEIGQIPDVVGAVGAPWRALNSLDIMFRAGNIDAGMVAAGVEFHELFRRANLDVLPAADPGRVPVRLQGAAWCSQMGGGNEAARRLVLEIIDELGGLVSPGGALAWQVLGLDLSLNTWARAGWNGKRLGHGLPAGMLAVVLGVLARRLGTG
jgi:hypothetical protein